MKRKQIYKGMLILLISVPSFAGNRNVKSDKACPMMKCLKEKAVENIIPATIADEAVNSAFLRLLI